MGDSITAGQYVDAAAAWPSLLAGCDVVSAGVSNDTTRLMLERFPRDVQETAADVVLLQAGHNDCNRWKTDLGLARVSLAAYCANVAEMIDRCRVFGMRPIWFTATPVVRDIGYAVDLDDYSRRAAQTARRAGADVVDMRAAFAHDHLPPLLLADGLHLSARGHLLYARVAQAFLEQTRIARAA